MTGRPLIPASGEAVMVTVFASAPGGGNPAPIVVDARSMTDEQMQLYAAAYGQESSFVVAVPDGVDADLALRFWVPNHEMSMCGHATVGSVWLLHQLGLVDGPRVVVHTASGLVHAYLDGDAVSISQPAGTVEPVAADGIAVIADALGITPARIGSPGPRNAATSRVKTLVPVGDVATLDALVIDPARVQAACDMVGSTGLYPYATVDGAAQVFAARQFPKSSGYPEDPATGIAAAALAFGLLDEGTVTADRPVRVRQGWAMGRPSEIVVEFEPGAGAVVGCRLGGPVHLGG